MRAMLLHIAAAALLLVFKTTIAVASTSTTDAPLQQAVEQLGSDDPAARDSAEAFLISRGSVAEPVLHLAITDPRPEVQLRARRALRTTQLFTVPGVSDEALSVAQFYLNGVDFEHRKPELNRLFVVQPQPNVVLTRLITLETDEDLRRQMLYQLATGYRQAIPRMLTVDDDLPGVLNVLDESAEMWGGAEAADDAAVLLLSDRLQDRIAICSAEQTNGDSVSQERSATQLCFLYRVSGKYDQAMKYARLSRDPALIFLVLQDQGDWSTATREPDQRWRDPIESAAYRSAFQRLAGHPDLAMQTLSAVSFNAPSDTDASYSPSRFFLLDDLPERGIELLVDQHPAVAFEMRVERGEIADAIAIAGQYENQPRDAVQLGQLHDQLRQTLGDLPEPATQPDQPEESNINAAGQAWGLAVQALNQKKYQAAAAAFGAMWAVDPSHFDRLYLQGYALKQAGQSRQGDDLMQKAQMLPLGDPLARWQLAGQLDAAGLGDLAEQQRQLGLCGGGAFDDIGFSEIFNTQAAHAIDRRQWSMAADALDRLCLINLSAQVQWHNPVRLLTIPALAHLVKARGALAHHNVPAATAELNRYLHYLPISSDMILEMVPALDDLGEHDEANALFNQVYSKLAAICQKYPRSITYLNQLAWMSACCDRRLDEALKAAQSTAQLEPGDWQVLDTLAEVQFRRGDRAAAMEIEKRAMSMTTDPYLARQVKRFESAPIPPTTQPGLAPQ